MNYQPRRVILHADPGTQLILPSPVQLAIPVRREAVTAVALRGLSRTFATAAPKALLYLKVILFVINLGQPDAKAILVDLAPIFKVPPKSTR